MTLITCGFVMVLIYSVMTLPITFDYDQVADAECQMYIYDHTGRLIENVAVGQETSVLSPGSYFSISSRHQHRILSFKLLTAQRIVGACQ